ncbi:MAG: hypothetical protein ABJB61_11730, partial [bacterium]
RHNLRQIQPAGKIANSTTYVTQLAPIKFTRQIFGFRRKTRLKFQLSGWEKATLRFQGVNTDEKSATFDRPLEWRLDQLGEAAIALVIDNFTAGQVGCNVSVDASGHGNIINERNLGQGQRDRQIFIWYFRIIDQADMVGWYDPMQLARTAVEVFFSTLFGRHSDYRLMEALTPDSASHFDFTTEWQAANDNREEPNKDGKKREDIWIDYVGDVGDGWNPTYAVAHCLSQPTLSIAREVAPEKGPCLTKRGDILIFGGDQVYPIANRLNYKQRLLGAYQTALESTEPPRPHAFAIPGNHDWYDSLVSFTRLFCQKRMFAGWQTDQARSYFALKLPGRWWVLGTDVQLDSDIDVPQVNYFKDVAKEIQAGDRVIICTAEPHWVYSALYAKDDSNYNENNLAYFEKKIIGGKAKVVAFIAGDQHHYRRFESADGTQKITAGGGGAFLHPTHGEVLDRLPGGFTHKRSYPARGKSIELSLLNLFFLLRNPWFGIVTGLFYMLTAWTVKANVSQCDSFLKAAKVVLITMVGNPGAVFWVIMLFLGFLLFTDTHSKLYRFIAGPLHGAAHVLACFFIGWWATSFTVNSLHQPFGSFWQLVAAGAIIFVGGWLVGSTIMGLYLLISLAVGRHSNEAFSALCIQDWKNFLRIRIEANGNLTLFPIGVHKVPRNWTRRKDGQKGPGYEPANSEGIKPVLIEGPILFTPVPETNGDVTVTISAQACLKNPKPTAGAVVDVQPQAENVGNQSEVQNGDGNQ